MTLLDPTERSARGSATQAEVTGRAAPEPRSLYQESWRDFVFAEVWTRPGLDRRARYLIAIGGAAMTKATDALDGYVRGALTSKQLSVAELREAALHLAVYGGWSRGGDIDASIDRALAELGMEDSPTPPIRSEPWNPEQRLADGHAEFDNVMTFPPGPPQVPYLEAINNFVFGEMWRRPGLDQRSRRWLTLVGVCESSAEIPIKSHVHAAMASGNCKPDEMQEFVLQYGVHAGWPKASFVQAVVFEMSRKVAEGKGWNG